MRIEETTADLKHGASFPAVRFSPVALSARAYAGGTAKPAGARPLRLDRNEGPAPPAELRAALAALPDESLQRYPSAAALERALADRLGVEPARVVATAGGDDAIDRLIRAAASPGRDVLIHAPTFEMIERSAALAGAGVRRVGWLADAFPVDALTSAIDEGVGCVALVSPNNPTGLAISTADLLRVADAAARARALALVDLAYVEFADEEPTRELLTRPNVAIVRTFSKAWGMAGLRVGWLAASAAVARAARALGGPFDVAGPSLAIALHALHNCEAHLRASVKRIRSERERLARLLRELGAHAEEGRANFVLARFGAAEAARAVCAALAERGVLVRDFPDEPALADALRITCPCDEAIFDRLVKALRGSFAAVRAEREGDDR